MPIINWEKTKILQQQKGIKKRPKVNRVSQKLRKKLPEDWKGEIWKCDNLNGDIIAVAVDEHNAKIAVNCGFITYTADEIKQLENSDMKEIRTAHLLKKKLLGNITYIGPEQEPVGIIPDTSEPVTEPIKTKKIEKSKTKKEKPEKKTRSVFRDGDKSKGTKLPKAKPKKPKKKEEKQKKKVVKSKHTRTKKKKIQSDKLF